MMEGDSFSWNHQVLNLLRRAHCNSQPVEHRLHKPALLKLFFPHFLAKQLVV